MTEPRKTTRSRPATGAAAQVEQATSGEAAEAAPPPPPAATAPTPTPPPAAAPTPPPPAPAPPPAAPAPPPPAAAAPAAAGAPPPGANVAAAISGFATDLRTRLSAAELLLGAGALLVAGLSYVIFGFLLDAARPSELAVLTSVALLLFMGLERTQREGFGNWYRVLLVVLGAVLAVGALYTFLNVLRGGFAFLDLLDWLSLLSWWAGGVLAGAGAWMSYRARG